MQQILFKNKRISKFIENKSQILAKLLTFFFKLN